MPRVPLAELKKTHEILCEMLESRVYSPFTRAQVEALKATIEREIAESEEKAKGQAASG